MLACRPSGKVVKHSALCLSLTSPVFRKMICGSFRERTERQMGLDDEDETPLRLAMELSYGLEEGVPVTDLDEMIRLAIFADRYEMVGVAAAVEDAIRRTYLTVETCLEVLALKERDQLPGVVSAARELALKRFADLSRRVKRCYATWRAIICLQLMKRKCWRLWRDGSRLERARRGARGRGCWGRSGMGCWRHRDF